MLSLRFEKTEHNQNTNTMKKHLFLIAALLLTATMMTSCFKDRPDTSKKGLYVGIIGFNDDLHSKTIKILNEATKDDMKEFINKLTMENGTVLYHAVNTALDKIEVVEAPEDLINVSIVTFTDGLDQGSYVMNNNYNSGEEYLNAVSQRIRTMYKNDIPITAYAIGVRGSDVTDPVTFRQNLEKLSSSSNNVFEIESMSQIGEQFAAIAQELYNQSSSYDVTLKTPAQEPGTLIRFTFDNVSNAEESQVYIQGIYSRGNNCGILSQINYVGLVDCGSTVYSESQGSTDLFTFKNLLTEEDIPVSTTFTKQWRWQNSTEAWINNSEFSPSGNTIVTEEFKSALIMLVLDCSSSLNTDFQSVKSAACQFIKTLNNNTHQRN